MLEAIQDPSASARRSAHATLQLVGQYPEGVAALVAAGAVSPGIPLKPLIILPCKVTQMMSTWDLSPDAVLRVEGVAFRV